MAAIKDPRSDAELALELERTKEKLWLTEQRGDFPKSTRLTRNTSGWDETTVQAGRIANKLDSLRNFAVFKV